MDWAWLRSSGALLKRKEGGGGRLRHLNGLVGHWRSVERRGEGAAHRKDLRTRGGRRSSDYGGWEWESRRRKEMRMR